MNIPFDIKEILESGRDTNARRNEEIRTAIFVDEAADPHLVDALRVSFTPELLTGLIHVSMFTDDPPVVSTETDVAVIAGGTSHAIGSLQERLRKAGVPSRVVTLDGAATQEASSFSGTPLATGCIIADAVVDDLLESLAKWILSETKKDLAYAANFPFIRSAMAHKIMNDTAKQNALVGGVVIIPGADMPIMTANQMKMLLQIAATYGKPLNSERLKELAAILGGGFALRTAARQAVGIVPALGWAVKAGIGYTGTLAMGKATIEYFEKGGDIEGLGKIVGGLGEEFGQKAKQVKVAAVDGTGRLKRPGFLRKHKTQPPSSSVAEDVVSTDIVITPALLPSGEEGSRGSVNHD